MFSVSPLRKIETPTDNYIINGDMYFSQRGNYTSPTSATNFTYYLDRWKFHRSGVTTNIQHLTAIAESASTKAYRCVATSTTSGYMYFLQYIEVDPRLLGQYVTVQALVRSNSAKTRLSIQTDVNTPGTTHSGSGGWEMLSSTIYIPTSTTSLGVFVGVVSSGYGATSIVTNDYFDVTDVSFVLGQTPREFMPFGGSRITELMACQRYYENSFSGGSIYLQAHYMKAATTTFLVGNVLYKVQKRVATTAPSIISVIGTAGKVSRFPDNVDIGGTVTSGFYSTTGITLLQDSGTAFIANTDYSFHWAVSAEY